jgi:hypothetical protein
MKKLILTNIQEGVRKLGNVKAIYEHMEAAYVDSMAEITKGLVALSPSYIILRGCVNSGSGSDYNISAGSILKDGEIFSVPAFVGTAPGGQVPVINLVSVKTQLQYTDNSSQDTLDNRTYAISFGATGTGLVDFSALVTLKTAVNAMLDVQGQIQAIVDAAPGALDTLNELAAALGDDANFAATVTTALAGKVAKTGDTMTGDLNFSNTQKVTGLADGSAARDAVNKQQLDTKVNNAANAVSSGIVDESVAIAATGTDYNSFTKPGIYFMEKTGSSNGPGGGADSVLLVAKQSGSSIIQIAITCYEVVGSAGEIWSRLYTGSWGSWTLNNDPTL